MKKAIITVFAALILSTSAAFAAPGHAHRGDHDGEGHGKQHMMRMLERLDVSEAQRTQITQLREQLHAEAAPQRDAMRENMQALREAKRNGDQAKVEELSGIVEKQKAEMKTIRETHHARLLEILTPEQREQFKAFMNERREKGRGHGKGHGNGHGRF